VVRLSSAKGKTRHLRTMMEFQAPELKRSQPHGWPADWFSYGAVAFFCLTGVTPNADPNASLAKDILALKYLPLAKVNALGMVLALVADRPRERITFAEVSVDPFFTAGENPVDWQAVSAKQAPSPIGQLPLVSKAASSLH